MALTQRRGIGWEVTKITNICSVLCEYTKHFYVQTYWFGTSLYNKDYQHLTEKMKKEKKTQRSLAKETTVFLNTHLMICVMWDLNKFSQWLLGEILFNPAASQKSGLIFP